MLSRPMCSLDSQIEKFLLAPLPPTCLSGSIPMFSFLLTRQKTFLPLLSVTRFALGLWIQHRESYHVVVLVTGLWVQTAPPSLVVHEVESCPAFDDISAIGLDDDARNFAS